jgi:hypothetical protein
VAYGDADWIVDWLSREHGRIALHARGARRSQKRFGGALSFFVTADIDFDHDVRQSLGHLRSASVAESMVDIARDMTAFTHGSYAVEVARELCLEGQVNRELYDLLVELYRCLREHGASLPVLRAFELRALESVGLSPAVHEFPERMRIFFAELQAAADLRACFAVEAAPAVLAEARKMMMAELCRHIGKPLRTVDFVNKLRRGLDWVRQPEVP